MFFKVHKLSPSEWETLPLEEKIRRVKARPIRTGLQDPFNHHSSGLKKLLDELCLKVKMKLEDKGLPYMVVKNSQEVKEKFDQTKARLRSVLITSDYSGMYFLYNKFVWN